ncbi:DUF262 domain-containing protein [Candidatus Saccharibacteria bacterium]|nr:DUF262 domain-containing protein [Candidatus Saccharibacteria bacterium]
MAYRSQTIKEAVLAIDAREYLLPVIQREMVWDAGKIEKLFDSIMSGYPFGSLLFWKYKVNAENTYNFYDFIRCYDEYDRTKNHNALHSLRGYDGREITAVIDGQQRLTALYIGLKGYMKLCKPRIWKKYRELEENYDTKKLYLDLLYARDNEQTDDDIKPEYNFKFKTAEEVLTENADGEHCWFEVGRVLDLDEDFDLDAEFTEKYSPVQIKQMNKIIRRMWLNFCNKNNENLPYFEETEQSFDRLLNIFIRINDGGEPLSYTDFLMSILANYWSDGREEINRAVDALNRDFDFDVSKDIFLRGCLFLSEKALNFNADNFNRGLVEDIKDDFENIELALRKSAGFFKKIGYSKDNLRSSLILLPLAYYYKCHGNQKLPAEEVGTIKRWVQVSILCRAYGGQTTSYLTSLRGNNNKNGVPIDWTGAFPYDTIMKITANYGRDINFSEDRIANMVDRARKGSQDAFTLLSILYPNKNYQDTPFHEDHIYPKATLSKAQLDAGGDFLPNLQLLEGIANEEKNADNPEKWLAEIHHDDAAAIAQYKRENYLFDAETGEVLDLAPENFEMVMEKRRANLVRAIADALKSE